MAHSSAPNSQTGRARNEENDQDYDSSAYAAMVAVNLISSARLILKVDSVFTAYSAQYLVDNVCPKMEDGLGETDPKLTVKDYLEFALKEGIPKAEGWPHLGCLIKPPSAYKPDLVFMKGEVIETKELKEAFELFAHQPVGARLHLFTPDIDRVGDGIFCGPSCNESSYVGFRDVIIAGVEKIEGSPVAEVKICYKKKETFIKVNMSVMFLRASLIGDDSQYIGPTCLIEDFCVPRLSIN